MLNYGLPLAIIGLSLTNREVEAPHPGASAFAKPTARQSAPPLSRGDSKSRPGGDLRAVQSTLKFTRFTGGRSFFPFHASRMLWTTGADSEPPPKLLPSP